MAIWYVLLPPALSSRLVVLITTKTARTIFSTIFLFTGGKCTATTLWNDENNFESFLVQLDHVIRF